uniref:PSP proline-rich domain-containing protein n=1 Tax=Tanacetum cinerariifolium TaxID=118510 RepID=A0A6L2LPL8_TANCI|nr:hypothetical protein [Tanacetum cinerariifolium]
MGADLQDELAIPSLKRVPEIDDEQASVQISFKPLPRRSKKKLEELLHQWSERQAQECSLSEGSDEDFECGEETYFPALNVGSDKSCTISVYMDNPVKKKQRTDDSQFNKDFVPTYDRVFEFALVSGDGLDDNESVLDILNASRCFNCDAYDHALKYYQNTPGGKFDGLKPGSLDPETQKLLGIGEFDPPPWLNKMRELGYPPGYLGSVLLLFTSH